MAQARVALTKQPRLRAALGFLALLGFVLANLQVAEAKIVTTTIKGTVVSGTDISGVMGFAPGTSLTGKSFALVFTIDDAGGSTTVTDCSGTPCISEFSYVAEFPPVLNPATAVLQIGTGSYTFGKLADVQQGGFVATRTIIASGDNLSYDLQNTGSLQETVDGSIVPATGTNFTADYLWEDPLSDSNLGPSLILFYVISAASTDLVTAGLEPTSIVVGTGTTGGDDDAGKGLANCDCNGVGDPIDAATGNVYEQFTDYKSAGPNVLAFTRYYNSMANGNGILNYAAGLGTNWRTNYDRYLQLGGTKVIAERPNGQQLTFTQSGSTWKTDTDVDVKLTQSGSTWTLTDHDDTVETYDTATGQLGTLEITYGQLQTIKARNGYTQTLSRTTANELIVTDSYGRKLTLTFSGLYLASVTTPDGLVLTYTVTPVSSGARLTSVSYNTTPVTKQTYLYTDSAFPFALTGITDENGKPYAAWTYDSNGRGTTSQHGSGADLTTVTYNADGSTTVKNALGVSDTYKFTTLQNLSKVTEIDRALTTTTKAATRLFTYDSNGYLNSATDWNGNKTTYTNNAHGQPTQIVEAAGSSVARTTTISYDPTWVHEPHQIVTPGLTSTFVYDASGNPHTRTELDTTTNTVPYSTKGQSRVTTWVWNATGELTSLQLPRTDVSALTTLTYATDGTLLQTKDALGHLTKVTSHTGGGLPLTVVDANSVTTQLAYDARLNLHTSTLVRTAGNLVTTYNHDAVNDLTGVVLPDGSSLTYAYDTAHRLTGLTDGLGNVVAYTLDALGDRKAVQTTNAAKTVTRKHSATFDALGRMLTDVGGVTQTTTYTYDNNGNVLTVAPPLPSGTTAYTYDALNRRSTALDPSPGGTTTTTYDAHDRVLTVKDANSHTTSYIYNGFGDRTQLTSPDSGKTVYQYDSDRNVTQIVKPGPLTANMTYDALDRLHTAVYPSDTTLNVTRTYDQTGHGFGIGRLTSVTDPAGTLSLTYDERANVTGESRAVTGAGTLKTTTTYDAASRVSGIAYPSGTLVTYGRDTMGRVTSILTTPAGTTTPVSVASAIAYEPFGPETALTYGNGIKGTYAYDLDYRPTTRTDTGTVAVQKLTYGYNLNDSVKTITDAVNAANSQALTYDTHDRLLSATSGKGGYGTFAFTWDPVNNIQTQTINGVATTYTPVAGSNQLSKWVSGTTTDTILDTPAGNIKTTSAGAVAVDTLTYNQANELSAVQTATASATYKYNFAGERLEKLLPGSHPILYQYSHTDGSLLAENDLTKGQTADYIYLNGRPIAEVNPTTGKLYFTHTDRLGTPQKLTDSTQAVVWSALYQPFGAATFSGTLTIQSLRLPGQYFDPETGLYHNGFRDYAPGLTRYVESDPIGLEAGMNAFQYVRGNPLRFVDPDGLADSQPQSPVPSAPAIVANVGATSGIAGICGDSISCSSALNFLNNLITNAAQSGGKSLNACQASIDAAVNQVMSAIEKLGGETPIGAPIVPGVQAVGKLDDQINSPPPSFVTDPVLPNTQGIPVPQPPMLQPKWPWSK